MRVEFETTAGLLPNSLKLFIREAVNINGEKIILAEIYDPHRGSNSVELTPEILNFFRTWKPLQ